jgi:hypothetical protein
MLENRVHEAERMVKEAQIDRCRSSIDHWVAEIVWWSVSEVTFTEMFELGSAAG